MAGKKYEVLNEITISQDALLHNYHYFTGRSHTHIAPVLKSNAYGHGLSQIGQFVDSVIHAPFMCVDSLYEAYTLYDIGVTTPILIMGYTDPRNFDVWKKLPFIFGISDIESLQALSKYQPTARIHIKIDTGMHRLGIQKPEVLSFIEVLRGCSSLKVEGIFSHLSQADDPRKKTYTKNQITAFRDMAAEFERAGYTFRWKHIAATAGAEVVDDPYFNLARIGLGLYGYSPFGPHTNEGRRQRQELKPALTLTSRIAQVKSIEVGSQVGYGGIYTAKQRETIAILPLGYNEGIPRALSDVGEVTVGGVQCPIIGRVSMNMTDIKLTRNTHAAPGDPVVVISPDAQANNSVYQMAKYTDTIPYEVLTSLHPSVRRRLI